MADQMIKVLDGIDLQSYVTRLKAKGLDVTEESAKVMIHEFFMCAQDAIQKSPLLLRAILSPLLVPAEAFLTAEADKIDGKINA